MGGWPDDLHEIEQALLDAIVRFEPGRHHYHGDAPLGDIWAAQVESRVCDHTARWMRTQGLGHYTIGSAGHESNAAIAAALRPTDPALLHYRSGAFYCMRARQRGGHDPVEHILAGLLALRAEPIAGGRHKVFGHRELAIIPQTSTIGSQLPRALGVALAIDRANRLGVDSEWPSDAVAVCSFGDASANHSTVQGAINAACFAAHSGLRVPLLLVCEDNGWGISVPTPPEWIEASLAHRPDLEYVQVEGSNPGAVFDTAARVVGHVRRGRPALLHLRTVRFLGHAGTDVESGYRRPAAVRADLDHDPLLAVARALLELGEPPDALVEHYLATRASTRRRALELADGARLTTREQVLAPLAPRRPDVVAASVARAASTEHRGAVFGGTLPEDQGALTLAETINRTLADLLAAHPGALVFGEDVGVKGGVYGVTRGLQQRFGSARVFDSVLDEQSILGLALGAGVSGLLPICEIQYLAYLHNAEDQLRGEASSLSFFSNGQFRNPMVVRIAGYAYQQGFGGHFHNDHSVAVLRDIPGLVIASPAHPSDAGPMLRTCATAAAVDGTVCAFVEPIARYHTRDLHEQGDGVWTAPYAPPGRWRDEHVPIGSGRVVRDGDDVLIVTWANGLYLSLQAARRLAVEGLSARVFDLRWLSPLPIADLIVHANDVGRVLVVDETRRSGGVAEGVVAGLVDAGYDGPISRVAAADSFIPLGAAAELMLVSVDEIVAAAATASATSS